MRDRESHARTPLAFVHVCDGPSVYVNPVYRHSDPYKFSLYMPRADRAHEAGEQMSKRGKRLTAAAKEGRAIEKEPKAVQRALTAA